MPAEGDVRAFDERAEEYEQGWLGRLPNEIADRTAEVAPRYHPAPKAILDVGCGTGYLLRVLAGRARGARELVGVDPAPSMVEAARRLNSDSRIVVAEGAAEHILSSDGTFDLVLSTSSFDHWADQEAGVRECARVLAPGVTSCSPICSRRGWRPRSSGPRRSKVRTRTRAHEVRAGAGCTNSAGTAFTR